MAVLPRATEYSRAESTRTAARQKPDRDTDDLLNKIRSIGTEKDPLTSYIKLQTEKSEFKEQEYTDKINASLSTSTRLVMEQNQLLRQIIDEIEKLKTSGIRGGGNIDIGRDRPGKRGRYGAKGRERLERRQAAKRAATAERIGKRAAEVVKGARTAVTSATSKVTNAISPSQSITATKPTHPTVAQVTPETRPAQVTPETRPQPTVAQVTPETRPAQVTPEARPGVTSGAGRAAATSAVLGAAVGQATGQDALQAGAQAAQSAATTVIISQAAEQTIKNVASRFISRAVLSKVPLAGLLASLWFAKERVDNGDWVGAGLEVSSGAAGTLGAVTFGIGTATSVAIDTAQLTRDVYKALYGKFPEEETNEQIRNANLAAIGPAITRALNELVSSAPRPTSPQINDETKARLLEIYNLATESQEANSIIGEDTRAGLGQLLRLNLNGSGKQAERARESMANVISRLEPLVTSRSSAPSRITTSQSNTAPQQATPMRPRGSSTSNNITPYSRPSISGAQSETEPASQQTQTQTASGPRITGSPGRITAGITSTSGGSTPSAGSTPAAVTGSTGSPSAGSPQQATGVTGDFATELNRVSSKFNVNPSDMLALMRSESSLNPQAVNASTGATGLIQFMPRTARSLGTTTEELRGMTAAQQMQYVEKYFDSVRLPSGASAGRLYAYVFLPGRANREVLTTRGEAYYDANIGLDMDRDGNITIADLDTRMARYGGTLSSASTNMAAADQAQLRGTGQQTVVLPAGGSGAASSTGNAIRANPTSEVSLNRRLEKQVA